jgi:hypothetical protein
MSRESQTSSYANKQGLVKSISATLVEDIKLPHNDLASSAHAAITKHRLFHLSHALGSADDSPTTNSLRLSTTHLALERHG